MLGLGSTYVLRCVIQEDGVEAHMRGCRKTARLLLHGTVRCGTKQSAAGLRSFEP